VVSAAAASAADASAAGFEAGASPAWVRLAAEAPFDFRGLRQPAERPLGTP